MLTKIKSRLTAAKNGVVKFHRNEKGLEALQVILIVAIAAIILALLKLYWKDVKAWFKTMVETIIGSDGKDEWGGLQQK